MDQVRRAAQKSLAQTELHQAAFRNASRNYEVITRICRALHVVAEQIYLLGAVSEQDGEEVITLLVWPISVVTCEMDSAGSLTGDIAVQHLNEYARGLRGMHQRTLSETLAIAARDWPE